MITKTTDLTENTFQLEPPRRKIPQQQAPIQKLIIQPTIPQTNFDKPKVVEITDDTFELEPSRLPFKSNQLPESSAQNDLVNHQIGTLLTCNDLLQAGKYPICEIYLNRPLTATEKMDNSLTGPILRVRPRNVPKASLPINTPAINKEIVVTKPTGETEITPITNNPSSPPEQSALLKFLIKNPDATQNQIREYSKDDMHNYLIEMGVEYPGNNIRSLVKIVQKTAKAYAAQAEIEQYQQTPDDDEKEEPLQGSGIGLKTPKFGQIGSFSISLKLLNAQKPKLSVYYTQSGARVVYFHPAPSISKSFVALIKHYLVNNQIHASYKKLNPNERDLFDKLIKRSKGGMLRRKIIREKPQLSASTYNFASEPIAPFALNIQDNAKRLTLVLGQLDARGGVQSGNHTQDLADEAKRLSKLLLQSRTITKKEYQDVLDSLN